MARPIDAYRDTIAGWVVGNFAAEHREVMNSWFPTTTTAHGGNGPGHGHDANVHLDTAAADFFACRTDVRKSLLPHLDPTHSGPAKMAARKAAVRRLLLALSTALDARWTLSDVERSVAAYAKQPWARALSLTHPASRLPQASNMSASSTTIGRARRNMTGQDDTTEEEEDVTGQDGMLEGDMTRHDDTPEGGMVEQEHQFQEHPTGQEHMVQQDIANEVMVTCHSRWTRLRHVRPTTTFIASALLLLWLLAAILGFPMWRYYINTMSWMDASRVIYHRHHDPARVFLPLAEAFAGDVASSRSHSVHERLHYFDATIAACYCQLRSVALDMGCSPLPRKQSSLPPCAVEGLQTHGPKTLKQRSTDSVSRCALIRVMMRDVDGLYWFYHTRSFASYRRMANNMTLFVDDFQHEHEVGILHPFALFRSFTAPFLAPMRVSTNRAAQQHRISLWMPSTLLECILFPFVWSSWLPNLLVSWNLVDRHYAATRAHLLAAWQTARDELPVVLHADAQYCSVIVARFKAYTYPSLVHTPREHFLPVVLERLQWLEEAMAAMLSQVQSVVSPDAEHDLILAWTEAGMPVTEKLDVIRGPQEHGLSLQSRWEGVIAVFRRNQERV